MKPCPDQPDDKKPVTTPIPVQLSEPEFGAFIFPHLSMPRRGPKCKLGYHRVFSLILWVLYTGMQWKCLRFEFKQQRHYGMKLMAYSLINLRLFWVPKPRNQLSLRVAWATRWSVLISPVPGFPTGLLDF